MCFVPLVFDCCIFLLSGDPYRSITSLQLIQNAAHVLTKTGQRDHTCPVLAEDKKNKIIHHIQSPETLQSQSQKVEVLGLEGRHTAYLK